MKKSTFINTDMLEPFVCNEAYTSINLMGRDLVGEAAINMNRGTLQPHTRLGGGTHNNAEIYYVVSCQDGAEIVTGRDEEGDEEIRYRVKAGDTVFIPADVFHWIDNRACDEPFELLTLWPCQEQNDMYFVRQQEWGTNYRFKEKKEE